MALTLPTAACTDDDYLCTLVRSTTGNDTAADWVNLLVAKPAAIVGLLLVGVVVRWLLHRIINRITTQAAEGTVPGVLQRGRTAKVLDSNAPALQRRQQRARTMGSLLKSITTGVVFTVVGFMAISELGYDIAPLIASAGILGIALGFGAQSLIADFLSGVFMILEDQYGVGDVVDLGEATGVVEAVGLRVTRLRDVNGTVWYVRNGEIMRVGNQSQNWARAVLDIPVAFGEDLARIRRVLGEIADALYEDPEYATLVLERPEVWGVERWDADAMVVRVVLKTAPLEQWNVARELRQRIKQRFDELSIEIPYAQRVVWLRQDGDESPGGPGSDEDLAPSEDKRAAAGGRADGEQSGETRS
ncbi:MAG: mechanosensitive ion channel family protein [Nocardioidaceae bacterium]|nr:mechanosensitive ion channel family protein [Nocardioidaceae bacterium]